MWRLGLTLVPTLKRLPLFCRTMASHKFINKRNRKPAPPREFKATDVAQKEKQAYRFGMNLYDVLSRMPNYGIGYRVYRKSWKNKGCPSPAGRAQPLAHCAEPACCARSYEPTDYHWLVTKVVFRTASPIPAEARVTLATTHAARYLRTAADEYAREGVGPAGVEGEALRDAGRGYDFFRTDTRGPEARVEMAPKRGRGCCTGCLELTGCHKAIFL
jgi:hypothetical protein